MSNYHNGILRRRDLRARDGLSDSQRYALIARGDYPKQIKLSERASGWIESEVDAWIQSRITMSRGDAA